ncbi:MAG: pyridoxal phosphate-dependent aminotransferase [bacterium]|nr:pyridoxal phosphate-dependent aminotransferase [bacterium]
MSYQEIFEPPALREVTLRVAKLNGVNLGQGVCLLPSPEIILDAANTAVHKGFNTYAPPQGIESLRVAIAKRLSAYNKIVCETENVLVTAGSTGALEVISETLLQAGDEVVLFRPFYPYHSKMFARKGVKINFVELKYPDWNFDPDELARAITPNTKLVLVNTPHNPTGKVFTESELQFIGDLCVKHNIPVISDEVYEYMTYDGRKHISLASLPGLQDIVLTVGSYSKTFAITGWRIGYLAAPLSMINNFRTLNDQIYVCAPTPLQHAVAKGIEELPDSYYENRLAEYASKRAYLHEALSSAGFNALKPQGAYYMLAGTSENFPGLTSEQVSDLLIDKAHLGAVPASDFLGSVVKGDTKRSNFLRFCYAVSDETLERAKQNLAKI